jgi:hypothetical protein
MTTVGTLATVRTCASLNGYGLLVKVPVRHPWYYTRQELDVQQQQRHNRRSRAVPGIIREMAAVLSLQKTISVEAQYHGRLSKSTI